MGVNSQRKLFEFFPFIVDLISERFVIQGSKQEGREVVSLCKIVENHGDVPVLGF